MILLQRSPHTHKELKSFIMLSALNLFDFICVADYPIIDLDILLQFAEKSNIQNITKSQTLVALRSFWTEVFGSWYEVEAEQ